MLYCWQELCNSVMLLVGAVYLCIISVLNNYNILTNDVQVHQNMVRSVVQQG